MIGRGILGKIQKNVFFYKFEGGRERERETERKRERQRMGNVRKAKF